MKEIAEYTGMPEGLILKLIQTGTEAESAPCRVDSPSPFRTHKAFKDEASRGNTNEDPDRQTFGGGETNISRVLCG